jgi:hypothetical protein
MGMSGSDHQRERPNRGMGQPRRRGQRLVSLGGGAAGLPSVTDAQLAALLYLASQGGLVDRAELRRDTLRALLRAGLVSGCGAYEVELTPLGLRVLVCVAPRLLEPQDDAARSRDLRRRAS